MDRKLPKIISMDVPFDCESRFFKSVIFPYLEWSVLLHPTVDGSLLLAVGKGRRALQPRRQFTWFRAASMAPSAGPAAVHGVIYEDPPQPCGKLPWKHHPYPNDLAETYRRSARYRCRSHSPATSAIISMNRSSAALSQTPQFGRHRVSKFPTIGRIGLVSSLQA